MFFKDFVSVKRQKIKKGASQTYDTPSCFVCVGTQLVDKRVISLKIHRLCVLSTYKTRLSTLGNPINCTFATEIGWLMSSLADIYHFIRNLKMRTDETKTLKIE